MVWCPCCILMACDLLPCISPACSLGSKRHWDSRALLVCCTESLRRLRVCVVGLSYLRAAWGTGTLKYTPGKALINVSSGPPRYRYKNLTLGSDEKNGPAEDSRIHEVLQNAAVVLAVLPEIGRLRVLLRFVGQILTLVLPCDHRVFRQNPAWFLWREEAIDAAFLESVQLNPRHNKGRNQMIYNYSLRLTNYIFHLLASSLSCVS